MTKTWYGIRQLNRHNKAFYRDFRMKTWTIEEDLNPNNFTSKRTAEEESKNWNNDCDIVKFNINIDVSISEPIENVDNNESRCRIAVPRHYIEEFAHMLGKTYWELLDEIQRSIK